MTTGDIVNSHLTEWNELIQEFQHVEQSNGRPIYDKKTGNCLWPRPWYEAMLDDPILATVANNMLTPVDVSDIAPMSSKLKKLAQILELPTYYGEASETPVEPLIPRTDILFTEMKIQRCSYCGDKMAPIELVKWKENRSLLQPRPLSGSGQLLCTGCKRPGNI